VTRRIAVLACLVAAPLASCGGGKTHETSVYFLKGYLAPLGYRGQLVGVERPAHSAREVVQAVLRGPTASERHDGLISTIPPGSQLRTVTVRGSTAIVDFSGRPPNNVYASGQLVYSLTELPGTESVALRFDGKPCCAYRMDGSVIVRETRRLFRYWQGEPCALRTRPDQAPCRPRPILVPGRFERKSLEGNIQSAGRIRNGARPAATCSGEGALIGGARFYECGAHLADRALGASLRGRESARRAVLPAGAPLRHRLITEARSRSGERPLRRRRPERAARRSAGRSPAS
jgi:Sporulation and spore germination